MGKAARTPVALVRGLTWDGPGGRAADLVRAPGDDLFRESPLQALHARRTIRSFGAGAVPRAAIAEAVAAACTAPAPHHTRPWLFVALDDAVGKRALLAAIASAWREDLRARRHARGRDRVADRPKRRSARLGAGPDRPLRAVRRRPALPRRRACRRRARDVLAVGRRRDPDAAAGAPRPARGEQLDQLDALLPGGDPRRARRGRRVVRARHRGLWPDAGGRGLPAPPPDPSSMRSCDGRPRRARPARSTTRRSPPRRTGAGELPSPSLA